MNLQNRSRLIFAEALENMLITQPYNKITVDQIAKECSTSRTTFYKYFKDKHDLVAWIFDTSYREMVARSGCELSLTHAREQWKKIGECLYLAILEKPLFYRKVVEYKGQNSFIDYLFEENVTGFQDLMRYALNTSTLSFEQILDIEFHYAGVARTIELWIKRGMKESPEYVQSLCERNMPPYLKSLLE